MSKNKKRTFIYALVVFMVISATGFIFSIQRDLCKDVKIIIHNNSAQKIKVTKLQYRDYDLAGNHWRKETTWTTLRIAPKTVRYRFRNLEHVGNDRTRVKIYVKKHLGGSRWLKGSWRSSEEFECKTRYKVVIMVN